MTFLYANQFLEIVPPFDIHLQHWMRFPHYTHDEQSLILFVTGKDSMNGNNFLCVNKKKKEFGGCFHCCRSRSVFWVLSWSRLTSLVSQSETHERNSFLNRILSATWTKSITKMSYLWAVCREHERRVLTSQTGTKALRAFKIIEFQWDTPQPRLIGCWKCLLCARA